MTESIEKVCEWLKPYAAGKICIAFSGGVDSAVLLKLACQEAKKAKGSVTAVTFSTKLHPKADMEEAKKAAGEMGAEHVILEVDESNQKELLFNPIDRCYLCKKYLFTQLVEKAEESACDMIMEGTNADDLTAYRPGIKAVRELQIKSPLAELGITKEQVRAMAKELGIEAAKKPSSPCLITRLPYGAAVDFAQLDKIGEGEAYLRNMGFYNVRLRLHDKILRLEIDKTDFIKVLEKQNEIICKMKELGFLYITLDLEGFRSGSMDVEINSKHLI